jgi:hypothetical protein
MAIACCDRRAWGVGGGSRQTLIYWPGWPRISTESEKRGFRFPSFSTTAKHPFRRSVLAPVRVS